MTPLNVIHARSNHTAPGPKVCPTCRRIQIEQRIARLTVKTLLAAGYALRVDNGCDDELPTARFTDATAALAAMGETDDERVFAFKSGEPAGWVYFVYGNDGWDVINDYTTNLDDALAPVLAYIDKLTEAL
jgi:hypothetical protein